MSEREKDGPFNEPRAVVWERFPSTSMETVTMEIVIREPDEADRHFTAYGAPVLICTAPTSVMSDEQRAQWDEAARKAMRDLSDYLREDGWSDDMIFRGKGFSR